MLSAFCAGTGYASSRAVNVLFAAMCFTFSVAFGLLVRIAREKGGQEAHFLAFLLLCPGMIVLMPAYYSSTETGGLLLGLGGWLTALFVWQALSRRGVMVWLAFPIIAAAAFASPWLALAFIPLAALTLVMHASCGGVSQKKRSKSRLFPALPVLAALLAGYAAIWIYLLMQTRGQGRAFFDYPNIPVRGLLIRSAELLPLFAVMTVIYIKAVGKAESLRRRVWLMLAMLSPLLVAGCIVFTDCLSGMAAGETVSRFQQIPLVVPCACAAVSFGFLLSLLAAGDAAVNAAVGEASRFFKQRPAAFIVLAVYVIKTTLTGGLSEWVLKAIAR